MNYWNEKALCYVGDVLCSLQTTRRFNGTQAAMML